jgi:hypothetical protein
MASCDSFKWIYLIFVHIVKWIVDGEMKYENNGIV